MSCRCCSRCKAIVLEGGSTLKPELGELRRWIDRPLLGLCITCSEGLLDWLRETREANSVLSPMPTPAFV